MEDQIASILHTAVAKFPIFSAICMALGIFRLALKPLFSLAHAIADATPSPRDNEILTVVESSRAYKALSWFLDFLFSIKLINPSLPRPEINKG